MAANKILNVPPQAVPTAVGNLLNCGITSLAGPTGFTMTQPYLIVKHVRILNKTGAGITLTLYKGATGGSAAGTEVLFAATTIPANQPLDSYQQLRLDSADFLTGIAGATGLTIEIDAEIGVSG